MNAVNPSAGPRLSAETVHASTVATDGRAVVIIAVSQAVARVLERGGVEPSRIRVVPDGVDVHRTLMPAGRDVLASLGVPAGASAPTRESKKPRLPCSTTWK